MNFKPNLWKIGIGLLVSVLLGNWAIMNFYCLDCDNETMLRLKIEIFTKIFLFFFVSTYILWSLIQPKRKDKA